MEDDMEKDKAGEVSGIDGYLFRLIATFEAAAMQQMGKIAHPLTGDVEVDLDGASDSIEMLAAIQRKTDGNLNPDEKRLLDHVLYQLRMNYVDVAKDQGGTAGAKDSEDAEGDDSDDGADEGSGDDSDGGSVDDGEADHGTDSAAGVETEERS
jgi:hypothetical protein